MAAEVHERYDLHNAVRVFTDRREAGQVLADMLAGRLPADALVLAVPAGGVPVAAAMAERLHLALDVAVVSKMTPPGNTEVGYGAVAWDGSLLLNEPLVEQMGLRRADVQAGVAATRQKVQRRVELLRGGRPMPALTDRTVILVDDGLASGFTMRVAVRAVHNAGAAGAIVAVPTAHSRAVRSLPGDVDELYCANVREGLSFAVADAYRQWRDVSEEEAAALLGKAGGGPGA